MRVLQAIGLLLFIAIVGPFFRNEDPEVTSASDAQREGVNE